jgi:hypothetical protein
MRTGIGVTGATSSDQASSVPAAMQDPANNVSQRHSGQGRDRGGTRGGRGGRTSSTRGRQSNVRGGEGELCAGVHTAKKREM